MLISGQFTYLAEPPAAHQSVYVEVPALQTSGQNCTSGNLALQHCWRLRNHRPYLTDQIHQEAIALVEVSDSLPEVSSTESAISCPLRV